MKRTTLLLTIGCVLIGILTFLGIRGIVLSLFATETVQGRSRDIVNHLPLTATQRTQYIQNEGNILIERQVSTLAAIQRKRVWAEIVPYTVLSLVLCSMVLVYRKTRPVLTITSHTDDGRDMMVTMIPIIKKTATERQMVAFAPVVRNLALAQGDAQDKALQMWGTFIQTTKALSAKSHNGHPMLSESREEEEDVVLSSPTPTFRTLLENGTIAPGQPLVMGYHNSGPEFRTIENLKALGVGGWQGSGKTLSCAYLMGSAVYAYGAEGYLLDPHRHHKESLTSRLRPLIQGGFVKAINPFYLRKTLEELDERVTRRLNGQEPCYSTLVVMIDELSRVVKTADDVLKLLISFLERCTEETRKANVLFCGISPKWTARHFGGRADIRGCLNSMLVHKMKPSQAKLLLEEPEEKALLKEIQKPGEGVLVTDYSGPVKVAIPYCTDRDFEYLATRLCSEYSEAQPMTPESVLSPIQIASPMTQDDQQHSNIPLLKPEEITQTIRSLLDGKRVQLRDIYESLFTNEDMQFETFRKKYQQSDKRPWQPDEVVKISQRLPELLTLKT